MNIDALGNAQQSHPAPVAPHPRDEVAPSPVAAVTSSRLDHQLVWLAQQGDHAAFMKLLNQALQPHHAQVIEVEVETPEIKLSIESGEVPDQQQILPVIEQCLNQLQLETITKATVYGQQVGRELPFWMAEMGLQPLDPDAGAATVSAPGEPEMNAQTAALVAQVIAEYEAGNRNFAGIDLKEALLLGVNLTLADLHDANFVWSNLSKAGLGHANLDGAQLRHANLQGANLQGAKLQGTDLAGANLTGANLSWAVLRGTNLTGADLTDVNLQHATLERVIMPDGTILD